MTRPVNMTEPPFFGFVFVLAATIIYLFWTLPAHAADLPPPPPRSEKKAEKLLPLQPGEAIIRDRHALPPNFPYSLLPADPQLRMKDPRAWA